MTIPAQNLSGPDVRIAAKRILYRRDFSRFFREQLKIRTKAMGLQPFAPNPAQAPIIQGAQKQLSTIGKIRQIIFKCRQAGLSTYTSGVVWNRTSLFDGVYAFVVAQDKTTVGNIFNMYDTFYRNMETEMRPPRQYFTKGTELTLGSLNYDDNGVAGVNSKLLVGEAKNINLGVGQSIHALHLSEVCRYPSSDSLKESLLPACSDFPGTVRILESTAHFGGGAAYFRDQCERAQAGDGEYQYHFVKWHLLPEYTIALKKGERLKLDSEEKYLMKAYGLSKENIKWRRQKISDFEGDVDMFRLSYPLNFQEAWITKEASTFPWDRLMEMRQHLRPPIERFNIVEGRLYADPNGQLLVWKKPEQDRFYDVGGDAAEGHDDGDWSVAEVIERGNNEQCAEWRGHCLPREFGDILAAIGRYYNNAQVGPEINHPGNSTMERLRDIYSNIYLWRKRDTIVPKITGKLGWQTNYESKNVMVNLAREKLYYRQVIIHSEVLWEEIKNYTRDYTPTGMITYNAATGFDDCCVAWMIAIQISEDENWEKFGSVSVREEKPKEPERPEDAYFDAVGLRPVETDNLQVEIGGWK